MNNLKFENLALKDTVLKAIKDMGFEEPSQIQAESIPTALQGFDIIGQAQTGTGKTAAFGCSLLSRIQISDKKKLPKALVLAPTRELAIQVNDELVRLAKYNNTVLLPIYGGQPIDRQMHALKRGVDVVVGTPGRILDLMRRGHLKLNDIEFLVLDEADEMLNMGFIDDLEEIVKSLKSERQTLLFSATMPDQIRRLAKNYETLCRVIDFDNPNAAIIFCKTKKGVDEVVEGMQSRGYMVEGMHGDMSQNFRMQTLKKFKEGNLDFLVATDVAARGIDVESVTHVINYDLPQDSESYVHRIGRTGRANREGIAYSLVTPKEYMMLKQIQRNTKSTIHKKSVPTADEILETKFNSIVEDVKNTVEENNFSKFLPLATQLDENYNPVDVAAALMKLLFDKEAPFDYENNEIESPSMEETRVFASVGRRDGITPKTLVNFIKNTAKVNPKQIGDIDIKENFSFINLDSEILNVVMKRCIGQRLNRRKVNIEVANKKKKRKR